MPLAKKMGNAKFFEIGPHLPTAPGAFLNHAPKIYYIDRNRTISARYAMLVLIFNAFWRGRYLMILKVALGLL